MKRLLPYLLVLFVLAVSCKRGPERISRGEMEEVMYQILMQDQYLKQNSHLRKYADTTLVYEGIFEQMGYDTDDFLASLEYYLQDPTRMEAIMNKVADRLEKESELVGEELREENWRQNYLRLYSLRPDIFHQPQPRPNAVDSLYVQFHKDSLFYSPHK